jgi:hypothetical protein
MCLSEVPLFLPQPGQAPGFFLRFYLAKERHRLREVKRSHVTRRRPMVTHFKISGHLACGHKGNNLTSTRELNRVKCRSCRNTDAYKEARKAQRNAARRASRKSKVTHTGNDWRQTWTERLTAMTGRQRLPRGFRGQAFV